MILESFSQRHPERGVTEIAEFLGLHKSTVHGILMTLENRGFIEKSPQSGKYRLGLRLLDLGTMKRESLEVVKIAHPILVDLAEKTQETVHLAIYDHGDVVYIDKIEPHNAVKIISYIGKRNPVYCTGVGKCLLAYQDENEVQRIIQKGLTRMTPFTITEEKNLMEELLTVRREGIAFDREEIDIGIVCAASPVRDYKGRVIAAVSVSAPTFRIAKENLDSLVEPVHSAAVLISRNLGYKESL